MELLGQRHRQAGQQCLPVHVDVGVELEAAAAPDRVGGLLGGDCLVRGREDRELVVQAYQVAADVDRIGCGGPVLQLLADVRHHVGHLALGVLSGAHVVGGDHRLHDIRVEHVHAHRQQERRAVLQGRLHQVADQRPHLPERESLGEGLDGIEACFEHIVAAFLPQCQAARVRILDGVEIDDLVADLAAVVVVQVRCVGLRDAVGVGEECAPIDQVCRVTHPVGQRGRAQRGRHRLAQGQQLFTPSQVLGVAGSGHAHHQPEVADRVVKAGRQGRLGALEQMAHALACEAVEQVVVAGRAAPVLGLFGLVGVFDAQVGVATELVAQMRGREQVELDAGAGRAGRVQRDQHLGHALVGAGLRHHLQHEAEAVAVHEQLLGGEVRGIREPGGELFGRAVHRLAEAEQRRTGRRAMLGGFERHDRGPQSLLSMRAAGGTRPGNGLSADGGLGPLIRLGGSALRSFPSLADAAPLGGGRSGA